MKIRSKLILVFLIAVASIGIVGFISISQLNEINDSLKRDLPNGVSEIEKTSKLNGLAEFIRYYDEVLTQSARNYAFTQDKMWEDRYKQAEPELDKIIKEAIQNGDDKDKVFFSSVDTANLALVKLEYQSLDLVDHGDSAGAVKILESKEYWDLKKVYEQGLRDYVTRHGTAYNDALVANTQTINTITMKMEALVSNATQLLSISVTVVLTLAIVLGIIFSNNITKSIRKLIYASNEISKGHFDTKIDIKDGDEIADLQKSFNLMAVSLQKSAHLLSYTEQKYKNLYEGSPILFRTIDLNGIILDCNDAYAQQLGFTKKEIVGKSIFDHVTEQSLDTLKESFNQWKNTGKVANKEMWLKRKDGTIFPVLLSATNLMDGEGKLIGSNTALRDISEIYEARKNLEESEHQIKDHLLNLQKLSSLKDDFLTMITHELKTPLVPIKSYIDILMSEKLGSINEEQKKRLEIIRSSTSSLLKLISDLLDAQKIELGQLKLNKDLHDLGEIIRNTVNKMKPDADSHGITITVDIEEPVTLLCDDTRIEQVLSNLISNSLDFCPKENGKINIKLCSENNHAMIIVKDNGIGIVKESIGKIFVKFYQVDTSRTREHGGTGVGLSVCKGIVEGHGGKIWAESEGRDKGAEIKIMLPLDK